MPSLLSSRPSLPLSSQPSPLMSSRLSEAPSCHLDQAARGEICSQSWAMFLPGLPRRMFRFLDFALRASLEMTGEVFARNDRKAMLCLFVISTKQRAERSAHSPGRCFCLFYPDDSQISRLRPSGFARNDRGTLRSK